MRGSFQIRSLPLQPGLGGEVAPLTECGRQLYRRAGRLLQHQRFQRLEVPGNPTWRAKRETVASESSSRWASWPMEENRKASVLVLI